MSYCGGRNAKGRSVGQYRRWVSGQCDWCGKWKSDIKERERREAREEANKAFLRRYGL